MAPSDVRVRRVYDQRSGDDGTRVLVDRLWPRGLARAAAHLDDWSAGVAPSTELRRWYGHDADKFQDFRRRYLDELDEPSRREGLERLCVLAGKGPLTLLTATKDITHSHPVVLAELLEGLVASRQAAPVEEGGDPACWMSRVCPRCGRLADEEPPTRCPGCGADIVLT